MQTHARLVIVGGGIAGCSLLYYLAKAGWTGLILVEKDELTSGTTWHSAGYVTSYGTSAALVQLHSRSWQIYETLEAEVGAPTGAHRTGSLRVTNDHDQITDFRRSVARMRHLGVHAEIVGRDELRNLLPILDCDDALGALYTREDGHTDAAMSTNAFAKGARDLGAIIHRQTRVESLRQRRGGEWEVITPQGTIIAGTVVAAAGMWTAEIGNMVGVSLPVVPITHENMVTEAVAELAGLDLELPVTRHLHGRFTFRQERDGLLVGLNDLDGKPPLWSVDGIPRSFSQELLPDDLDRVAGSLESAIRYLPVLGRVGVRRMINGPTSRTTDQIPLVGPVAGRDNLFVMGGFTAGITEGPAVAEQLARWIIDGEPGMDLRAFDARRFAAHVDKRYVCESLRNGHNHGLLVNYPNLLKPAVQPVRASALHDRLEARGARFFARNGWDCPAVFTDAEAGESEPPTFDRPQWTEAVAREQRCALDGVAVMDLTSLSKYEISGAGARAALDAALACRLPRRAGGITLAPMLSARGGVLCHFTLARLEKDRFYLTAAAAAQVHHMDCLRRALPASARVRLDDVTARHGVLLLTGPRAPAVMARLTGARVTHTSFPPMTARSLRLGGAPVWALRCDSTGGAGWELHHSLEFQIALYEALMMAGEEFGIADMGLRAFEGLRIEARTPIWGSELSPKTSPLEANLEDAVDLDKGEFVGRDAVAALAGRGAKRALACLTINADGDEAWLWGGEPVRCAGRYAGFVASAGLSARSGQPLGLAYLPVEALQAAAPIEVELPDGPRCASVLT